MRQLEWLAEADVPARSEGVNDLALQTISLFSGVGMLDEGLRAGLAHMGIPHRTLCHVEREAHAAAVLVARMEEGSLDAAPVWSDLCTFDAAAWRGKVDCVVAGFPCQDLSLAGRRAGLDGARSGLFFNVVDIADACGAWSLFLENVAGIASATASVVDEASASDYAPKPNGDGFSDVGIEDGRLLERAAARVLGELADRGWHAEWVTLSASDVGASHGRARWFCWAWRELDDAGRVQWRAGHEQDRPAVAEACGHQANHRPADRSPELGHPRLQHQYLQQRSDGAEHPRAGGELAHAPRDGRHPRWTESSGEQGRSDASIGRGAVAHAGRQCHRTHEPQPITGRCNTTHDCAGSYPVANTCSAGQQRPQLGTACDCDGGGESTWTS